MLRAILACLAWLPAVTPAVAADLKYTVLLTGRPAGEAAWTEAPDGTLSFRYAFTDRGRGPDLTVTVRLRDDGTTAALAATGVEYRKAAVDESFVHADGTAAWRNRAGSGSAADAHGFYLSLDGTPQELALLARAAARAPGGRLPLLPSGEAAVEEISTLELVRGDERRTVTQYAVSGLDFAPSPVWLTPDGRLFAQVSAWLTTIEAGWEGEAGRLLATQDAAAALRSRALAERASRPLTRPLAFTGVRVFDAAAAAARDGWTVLVDGGRIVAAGPDGSVQLPPDAEVVAGAGRTLLPGLWDMHVHVQETDGPLNIASGVTSVRDMANVHEQLDALRRAWDAGSAVGPRIVACGIIDGRGPFQAPSGTLVSDAAEAVAAVDRYAALGYAQVKLYSSVPPGLVPAIVAAARRHGMRVSGHVPAFMSAEQAIAAGYDEIQHLNMLLLNFWADEVKETQTMQRFTAVGERAVDLDLGSPRVQAFVELLAARDIVVDPTLAIFEHGFVARPGSVSPGYAGVAGRLPVEVARSLASGGWPVPDGMDARYRAAFDTMLRLTRRLHEAGVRLVAGTDALSGYTLHRELELYVQAGIPAPEVLRIATLGAARVAGRDAELGSITAGMLADLVLVDGDPTTDISDVRRPVMVVKGGRAYDPASILSALGVRPATN